MALEGSGLSGHLGWHPANASKACASVSVVVPTRRRPFAALMAGGLCSEVEGWSMDLTALSGLLSQHDERLFAAP